ncbi:uncharacterized protein EAE98_009108 [Botrytis deweyae]|uniref:F-box domain-containing protein n=1 Tax=Botrytis deweyae TaxID=2478750 RepID=A0ABQ7IC70_9HELO|nr:uncharacterized protein EAE98_009108 [Botrytis deweyae]KAF7919874.1 hypothetical protein EAE98_009108 [Botrytis deweyae]
MENSIESQPELELSKSLRDTSFDFGTEPEGEPGFHASSDLGEGGGAQAGAEDDSFPSLNDLGESIVSTVDTPIANFDNLLSRRGIVQQPRLFKLSDELLELIVGFLAEPQLGEPPSTVQGQMLTWMTFESLAKRDMELGDSVKMIQSLRLVCRRFCNVASSFLLPTVRVELDAQSLARLDMISRHPTIGKSVRRVTVITRCLDRMSIDSFENFRHHKLGYLNETLETVEFHPVPVDEGEESRMIDELYLRCIYGSGDSITDKSWSQTFWSKAYERYKYLHAEQKFLSEENVFLEGVGTAVARMPRAKALRICDRGVDGFYDYILYSKIYSRSKYLFEYSENEDLLIDDIIKSKVFGIEDDDLSYLRADTSWSSPSAQIFLRLPGAIHKAGRSLENICIEIKRPDDHRTLASFEDFQELSAATQRLKQLKFHCIYDEDDARGKWTPTESDGLVKYLSAIVNTNALEKIDIHLSRDAMGLGGLEQDPSVRSLGAILTSRKWPNLRSIYLSLVPLHLSELETFIDNLKSSDVEMRIQYIYLISGSWSDGLEIFKRNSIQNLVLSVPISSSERRALLASGKLVRNWQGRYYWNYGHSLVETRTSDDL